VSARKFSTRANGTSVLKLVVKDSSATPHKRKMKGFPFFIMLLIS
jgi:hypothetical protein